MLALPFSFYHKERRNLQQVNQGEKIAQIACRVAASSNQRVNRTARSGFFLNIETTLERGYFQLFFWKPLLPVTLGVIPHKEYKHGKN